LPVSCEFIAFIGGTLTEKGVARPDNWLVFFGYFSDSPLWMSDPPSLATGRQLAFDAFHMDLDRHRL